MYQVGVSFVGEGVLDYAFNGRRVRRMGNRHETIAPHGCYPCRGSDQWVVIAARDDDEWRALCDAMGMPELTNDARFADPTVRHRHQDDLDGIICGWTGGRDKYRIMEVLQGAGVPAGPVLDGRDLLADPHFRARGYFEPAEHNPETGLGRQQYVSRGWRMSGNDVGIKKPGPMLGEDNQYVLSRVLGLDESEIAALEALDAVGKKLAGAQVPASVPLDRQVELGWTVDYDSDFRDRFNSAESD